MKRGILLGLAVALGLTISGCGGSNPTCEQYGQLDYTGRSRAIDKMIEREGLAPNSNVFARTQIGVLVTDYCGSLSLPGSSQPASKNLSSTIDRAVNWDNFR